ncbi:MAG: trypsin-like serine protease [Labilithrix sp.]|nr:trypsin-like serine protease [Labilithrix sp.]MCW5817308.1 trypsin-like serine protease [Labilithrix sp.]
MTQAIQGGAVDTTSSYAVAVCREGDDGACVEVCTGTLLLPNLVVTARHCIAHAPSTFDCADGPTFGQDEPGRLAIGTRPTVDRGGAGWHNVDDFIVSIENSACGNDIALLVLADLVTPEEVVPATPELSRAASDPAFRGRFVALGYGATGPATNEGVGARRVLENIPVVCVPGEANLDCPPGANVHPSEMVGGSGVCSGDSGSGAFEQGAFDRGEALLLGVFSRGGEDREHCFGSIYTRLDRHRDLVLTAAREASADFTKYPRPAWAMDVSDAGAAGDDAGVGRREAGDIVARGSGCACAVGPTPGLRGGLGGLAAVAVAVLSTRFRRRK